MKKSKDRNAFTIAQDKKFREKLELVKKKSFFVEETIRGLEIKRDRSNFILNCFKKSMMLFPTIPVKPNNPLELREWPKLSLLKEADQPMTQEQMEELWKSVEDSIKDGSLDNDEYVFIDFEKSAFVWQGSQIFFLDATIELTSMSVDPLKRVCNCFDLCANSHLRGAVYLWDKWDADSIQGLLKVVDDEGKSYFVELEHFSMMNLTLTCEAAQSVCKAEDNSAEAAATEGEAKSEESSAPKEWVETISPGMFILMNQPWQALFATRF